jgi:hypothetical protein
MNGTTAIPWWRRALRWPLFGALAALHLLVLPLVFAEPGHRRVALAAGVAYLLLAIADRYYERYERRAGR